MAVTVRRVRESDHETEGRDRDWIGCCVTYVSLDCGKFKVWQERVRSYQAVNE